MPVKWLYVLHDGKIVSPTTATNSTLAIPGVTKDNPVTGRIAFWTDDETCKVNINTASKDLLDALPEIGPVKAQAIIDGRPYQKIEDVMKVKGIKQATFDKIKDKITVN